MGCITGSRQESLLFPKTIIWARGSKRLLVVDEAPGVWGAQGRESRRRARAEFSLERQAGKAGELFERVTAGRVAA